MKKRIAKGQDRAGNPARRRLEFEVIRHQVKNRGDAFVARMERNLIRDGAECRLYQGTCDRNGYPRINFRYHRKHVTILACRVFLILKLCKPIPRGHDASHVGCRNRRCVFHLESLPFQVNANTNQKCPF